MIPSSSNFNPQNYVSFLDFAPCCSSNTHLYREVASLLGWYYYFFICLILGSLSLLFFLALNLHRNALKSSSISSIFIATFRTKIVQVDFAWISEPIFLFMVSTSTLESFFKETNRIFSHFSSLVLPTNLGHVFQCCLQFQNVSVSLLQKKGWTAKIFCKMKLFFSFWATESKMHLSVWCQKKGFPENTTSDM